MIAESEAEQNYDYHMERLGHPPSALTSDNPTFLDFALQAPSTHTFPREIFDEEGTVDFGVASSILTGLGLLSESERDRAGRKLPSKRSMPAARSAGLQDYVFTRHGAHDPYYAFQKKIDAFVYPFGVFVAPESEKWPQCVATRCDLALSTEPKLEREMMRPTDARTYAAFNIDRTYGSDFWLYWRPRVDKESLLNLTPDNVELHFLKQIPCEDFVGLLWPLPIIVSEDGNLHDCNEERREIAKFRDRVPGCTVFPYYWDPGKPSEFSQLSNELTKNYLTNGGRFSQFSNGESAA